MKLVLVTIFLYWPVRVCKWALGLAIPPAESTAGFLIEAYYKLEKVQHHVYVNKIRPLLHGDEL